MSVGFAIRWFRCPLVFLSVDRACVWYPGISDQKMLDRISVDRQSFCEYDG